MFKTSELKVQLGKGHEFRTNTKFLLPITFDPGSEYIISCYVVNRLSNPVVLGIQWF